MIVLSYLLKVHLVFTILFLVYYFLLRKQKFLVMNRIVLLTLVIAALALPLLPAIYKADFSRQVIEMSRTQVETLVPLAEIAENSANQLTSSTKINNGHTVIKDIAGSVLKGYMVVIAFCLLRLLVNYLRVIAMLRTSKQWKSEGVTYCEVASQLPPFSFFNFIVLPRGVDAEKLQQIIVHEQSHCRQGHSFDLLLADLTVALLWANPMAYLYRHELRLNLEYLADQAVIGRGIDTYAYQLNLLSHATKHRFNLPVMPLASKLKARIRMMNATEPRKFGRLRYLALLPTLCLLSMLTGFASLTPKVSNRGVNMMPKQLPVADKNIQVERNKRQSTIVLHPLPPKTKAIAIPVASAQNYRQITVDARTDTVKFRFTDKHVSERYAGIYVINNRIFTDDDIRNTLQSSGQLQMVLPARPQLTVYSANDSQAMAAWGDQAQKGVIAVQVPSANDTAL